MKIRYVGRIALAAVAIGLLGGVVMLLWNAVAPALFVGAHTIDYLHALGLLILSRILFGGFRGGRPGRRRSQAMWERLTPQERESFVRQRRFGEAGGDQK
jgi:hypothetical protein